MIEAVGGGLGMWVLVWRFRFLWRITPTNTLIGVPSPRPEINSSAALEFYATIHRVVVSITPFLVLV